MIKIIINKRINSIFHLQNFSHMKLRFTILILSVLLFSIGVLKSQSIINNVSTLQLKSGNSVLFGKDIIINDNPTRDQRQVSLCSDFNGWLYAVYSYINQGFPGFTILKSIDNGITWTVFYDGYYPEGAFFSSIDILVTGDSISNLKLFLAIVVSNAITTHEGEAWVLRFNGETGIYEDQLFFDFPCYCLSIASDFMYPAINSNPHSLGLLYSKYSGSGDSIIFRSSSNSGMSLDNRKIVATSTIRFHNVALTYGRSFSQNNGRYYAAWEEKADFTSNVGHIYTAHTEPNFNSSFTTPVMLDNLDASAYNNAKNPAIACQYNNTDNDSSNLTEIILFDKFITTSNKYDIEGFYNMKSTNTANFKKFTLNTSSDNKQQPWVNFNPFDSTFMVTYYNATIQKLHFLLHNFNMSNADSWQVLNSGYNDSSNLVKPYPRVVLNIAEQQGANVWAAEGTGGNGIAMFDAPYSIYTGFTENNKTDNFEIFHVYPNPCSSFVNVAFELRSTESVTISITDLLGKKMEILQDQVYHNGIYLIKCDVSHFPQGSYLLSIKTQHIIEYRKILIIR